jgi:hypothetical protein
MMITERIPLAICFLVLAFVLLAPQRWEDRSVAFVRKLASVIFADPIGLLFYFGCLLFATSPAWFFYLARVTRQ